MAGKTATEKKPEMTFSIVDGGTRIRWGKLEPEIVILGFALELKKRLEKQAEKDGSDPEERAQVCLKAMAYGLGVLNKD